MPKKVLKGTVKSISGSTAIVTVTRSVSHKLYGKIIKRSKNYPAHTNSALEVGSNVTIEECKPISKTKRFMVIDMISEAK